MLCAKPIELIETSKILPNESVIPERVDWLTDKIKLESIWRVPITLDRASMAVMDGHHRTAAALRLKLPFVPCILLDYSEVGFVSTHKSMEVTPQIVGEYARSGKLFPPKSTRHVFSQPLPTCNISLALLNRDKYTNVNDNGFYS